MSYNHITYFQNIAETLKDIANSGGTGHFSRIGDIQQIEGFLTNAQYAKGFQLLIFDKRTGNVIDKDSDNILIQEFYHFMVLGHVTSIMSDKDVVQTCNTIAHKIISLMLHHKRNYQHGLQNLIVSSINFEQVGPLGSGWYGLDYSFRLNNQRPAATIYNANDWIVPEEGGESE